MKNSHPRFVVPSPILLRRGEMLAIAILASMVSPLSAQRPADAQWTTSRVHGTPDPPSPLTVEQIFADIEMKDPTEMVRVPGTDRWLVTQLNGRIFTFSRTGPRDIRDAIDWSTISPRKTSLYGITFHPQFPAQPWCYIAYTAENQSMTGTRLSRFHVTDPSTPTIDAKSEVVYAEWNSEGHSGGSLHFGDDGYLYVSVGDGQNPNPPDRLDTGQDLSDLEASILRIDVDRTSGDLPYAIPDDNPLVGQSGVRGEIWAYGLRNPWKMAFDPKTGTLWTGDVGWEMMEMVYRIDRGGNYGWSVMEGSQVVKQNGRRTETPITPPIVEHNHLEARSITGGYFWYSDRLPELNGAYLYGDWMTGKIWGVRHDGTEVTWQQELADTSLRVICFALDDDGEVLVVGYDGTVHRLVRNDQPAASASFPRKLSETGLFTSTHDQIPAAGVFRYEINAHHWADNAESQTWIAIPGDQTLDIFESDDWKTGQVKGHFVFPHDTVLVKTVSLPTDVDDPQSATRLETQLLHRNGDDWNAYNYVWNERQTDAELQDNIAIDREFLITDPRAPGGHRKQTWHHASRDECLLCHIWSASTIHGFKLNQLNRPDPTGDGNQVDRLASLGLFRQTPPMVDPIVSPDDESADLEARARSYLHMNCAHCHRRGGGGTAPFELVGDLPLDQLNVVDAPPTQGDFGIQNACVVATGDPHCSVLMYRLVKSGRGHMPQFGPTMIDDRGVRLVRDWIGSLSQRSVGTDDVDAIVSSIGEESSLDEAQLAMIEKQLTSTSSALALSLALYDDAVADSTRLTIAKIASRHGQSVVRDLFERFLPEEDRVKRLGTVVDEQQLLAMNADVQRGRQLYFESADVSCRQCHRIGGTGAAVGPDLDSIGIQRSPAEILESILRPSSKIDEKYRGKLVLTIDGILVSGLVVAEDDQKITLVDPSGKTQTIAADEVESIKAMEKSVMPDLLLAEFTAQQAADLLGFLIAQKKPVLEE